ncbi:hypothetical protein RRG08_058739 [Elysia crispata]|uniref:Uncharacterized protein n=1 Tax=Elysia crispata TaxID=231223 RepID=A0AAE0YWH7_9GAST|nr:hypothetical protein RRG08_058739 [Elysia crispata]
MILWPSDSDHISPSLTAIILDKPSSGRSTLNCPLIECLNITVVIASSPKTTLLRRPFIEDAVCYSQFSSPRLYKCSTQPGRGKQTWRITGAFPVDTGGTHRAARGELQLFD